MGFSSPRPTGERETGKAHGRSAAAPEATVSATQLSHTLGEGPAV